MDSGRVPKNIIQKYTDPANSYDGEFIDKDHPFVKLWCEQVVGNETNPLEAANRLYQNLTETFNYNETFVGKPWKSSYILLRAARNESAGVCSHFSRAFAALCMANNIPARCIIGTLLEEGKVDVSHEWNEIYLQGYGWVSVDIANKRFGKIPNMYLSYATKEVFFVEKIEECNDLPPMNKTRETISKIISVCKNRNDKLSALINTIPILFASCQTYPVDCNIKIGTSALLLEMGQFHEALIEISKAYLLLEKGEELLFQSIMIVIAVVGAIFFIVFRKWRIIKRLIAQFLRTIVRKFD